MTFRAWVLCARWVSIFPCKICVESIFITAYEQNIIVPNDLMNTKCATCSISVMICWVSQSVTASANIQPCKTPFRGLAKCRGWVITLYTFWRIYSCSKLNTGWGSVSKSKKTKTNNIGFIILHGLNECYRESALWSQDPTYINNTSHDYVMT